MNCVIIVHLVVNIKFVGITWNSSDRVIREFIQNNDCTNVTVRDDPGAL